MRLKALENRSQRRRVSDLDPNARHHRHRILVWLVYGLQLGAFPIVLANAVCLVLSSFVLAFKLAGADVRFPITGWLTGSRRGSAEKLRGLVRAGEAQ